MIFMSMSDHKSLYLIPVIFQIGNIRNYQIHAQHIVFRKRQATVHYNNALFSLERCDIHSDLLKTSQGNDLYGFVPCQFFLFQN